MAFRDLGPAGSSLLRESSLRLTGLKIAALAAMLHFAALPVITEASSADTNCQATVIVAVGAPGEEGYGEPFTQWADRWRVVCQYADAKFVVVGLNASETNADRDQLKKLLDQEPKDSAAELWLVLIGHGTFDGKDAKFNLRGPDLAAGQFAEWLQPFQRPLVLINCASGSGPFINQLSKAGRVVIAGTRSGFEQNYARFGDFISASISDPSADLDKDGQTSLLEAFLTASNRVGEFYKNEGRLATEHALLDDNGDGRGTQSDWFKGTRAVKKAAEGASVDGLRAHQIHLVRSKQERELPAEVRARRDKIELEIAKLREIKDKIPEDGYYQQLEPLLLDLAHLYEKTGAAQPHPPR